MLFSWSCSSSSEHIRKSGDEDADKTAYFVLYNIRDLKKVPKLNSPSAMITYITSTAGSATITPPDPEYEPDAAEAYRGPRPSEDVWIQSDKIPLNSFFKKHLVLSSSDAEGLILAKAYKEGSIEPFFVWEWQFDNL
jgi:hypothetical protein